MSSTTTAGQALVAYYNLLPGNPAEAWKLLTGKFRASKHQTYQTYTAFWSRYSSVKATTIQESGNRVTARITYSDGKSDTNTFTLVQEGGVWMIDAQS